MRIALIAALALAACNDPSATPGDVDVQWQGGPQFTRRYIPADLPAFFDCLQRTNGTAVSAHRGGARAGLPENAIATFEAALREAPVFLEVDVRAARDGLVLMHDETVDRTTNGRGGVADMTIAQIQALTLDGGSSHPPTLRQALDWAAGRAVLELDVKQNVRFEDVIEDVRAAGAMERVVFITYSVAAASRLARLAPEAMLYVTIESERDLDELERRGVDLRRVVAWTGVEEPDSALNVALAERGVEARFGMFGAPASQAAAFAETGLQIIATDEPAAAVANLDAHDGVEGYGALQCAAAR